MPQIKMRENGKFLVWVKVTVAAVALVVSLGGFALTHERRHSMTEADIVAVKKGINQEMEGYKGVFAEINRRAIAFEEKFDKRMARMESRIDRILENQAGRIP